MGGTLLQKQGDEWVVIGYHSKRLPKSAKNFGITELELTGLLANIHGFMQLLRNRYFAVLVDHKAIKYIHRAFIFLFSDKSLCTQDKDIRHNDS